MSNNTTSHRPPRSRSRSHPRSSAILLLLLFLALLFLLFALITAILHIFLPPHRSGAPARPLLLPSGNQTNTSANPTPPTTMRTTTLTPSQYPTSPTATPRPHSIYGLSGLASPSALSGAQSPTPTPSTPTHQHTGFSFGGGGSALERSRSVGPSTPSHSRSQSTVTIVDKLGRHGAHTRGESFSVAAPGGGELAWTEVQSR